jgi:hypothetical protein
VVDAAVSRLGDVLRGEELEKLLAPEGGDVAKRLKGKPEAPRDKQKDGKNVWEELERRLNALRDMLNDDKIAREVVAPALLLIQAERLGVNETTLRYFGAVASGAIGGDGCVSAAGGKVVLARGKLEGALLWGPPSRRTASGRRRKTPGVRRKLSCLAAMPPGWSAYTSSTGILCLRRMKELLTIS